MPAVQPKSLEQKWKDRLDLSTRKMPEFYEDAGQVGNTPHAGAIRTTLSELGVSAVFCVQDVPTIAILSVDEYDRKAIVDLHAALWNQGLASLLVVLSGDTVRAFSLTRTPYSGEDHDFDSRCLVRELNAVTHALEIRDIIYGAESGRFWEQYAEFFSFKERIDQVLLNNLTTSHKLLLDTGLSSDAAQALLIQTMFIAYLEDREIIDREYFLNASNSCADSFSELLKSAEATSLERLFRILRQDFNGDLFVAPCSFEVEGPRPIFNHSQLKILARFRSGYEEMSGDTGQLRFWGYDFKYIPIELISAVYDRFLGEREESRREQGAYYTPMFLADTVISQVWDTLTLKAKDKGRFLDPACGSGVFLVRSFQRLCERWRETKEPQTIRWDSLLAILSRLEGWDTNSGAVRIAVFSLYVALLEEVSPPDIRLLIERDRFLPQLWGRNLCHRDFFTVLPEAAQVDVVIGNPPWSSRQGANHSSIEWCKAEGLPIPSKEDAWAFVWKSLRHLREGGTVAFLLPAMGFLHNHSKRAVDARKRFMRAARIYRVINFADLRFQLFERAVRPATLIVFGCAVQEASAYRFDYWVPKADLNLKTKRLITISSADKCLVNSDMAEEDPFIFKKRLWMTEPEAKLFNYLSRLPNLGALVSEFGSLKRSRESIKNRWMIGHGFKPANVDRLSDSAYKRERSDIVATTPYLPIADFCALVQNCDGLRSWENDAVHRRGFEDGFKGQPRVLIPRGINTTGMRLRATYVEEPLTFQHIIQAVVVPRGEERRAKLLTALLNSRVILWFAFHGTASFGSDRPVVQQAELLRLPFPSSDTMPEPNQSRRAENGLISIIDEAIDAENGSFQLQTSQKGVLEKLDRLAYDYFCLSDEEIILVEDTVKKIIPAVQPSRGSFPDIWKPSDSNDRKEYVSTLVGNITDWLDSDYTVGARLEAYNKDLAVLCLSLREGQNQSAYVENADTFVGEALSNLLEHIHQPLPGNFQLMPDFRVFIDKNLYLVKPVQKRFWLRSAALADADAIALDLQDVIERRSKRNNA